MKKAEWASAICTIFSDMGQWVREQAADLFDKHKDAIFQPGWIKTSISAAIAFWAKWTNVAFVLQAIILVGTAIVVTIHAINAIVRQWCPVRRGKVSDCSKCALCHTLFCSRGIKDKDAP